MEGCATALSEEQELDADREWQACHTAQVCPPPEHSCRAGSLAQQKYQSCTRPLPRRAEFLIPLHEYAQKYQSALQSGPGSRAM